MSTKKSPASSGVFFFVDGTKSCINYQSVHRQNALSELFRLRLSRIGRKEVVMNTDVIPMIVALSVTVALVAPVICLFIKHPPKPVDPCKVIEAFGNAVEAGRQQDLH